MNIKHNKSHCKIGHEFTPENTRIYKGYKLCKACARIGRKKYRLVHPDRERKSRIKFKISHPDKVRENSSLGNAKHARKYPEKIKARNIITHALERHLITRKPCEICGSAISESHHDDYKFPLDVRWLCRKHHEEYHHKKKEKK